MFDYTDPSTFEKKDQYHSKKTFVQELEEKAPPKYAQFYVSYREIKQNITNQKARSL